MANFQEDKYTRRSFIKFAGYILVGSFMALWYVLTNRTIKLSGGKGFQKVSLWGKPDGTYFFDSFLISKKGASLIVLTNRCTHAGCKINKEQNCKLVCGCHGSVYSSNGEVLKGPARKALSHLPYSTDPVTGDITVQTNSSKPTTAHTVTTT
ncbi:MAG TPA: Rieske (2Fe-2S) protein [Lentimicrobium sp.]|nr:Rieske (2Fe-2S) protein [Lentimicrobium sp.]